ncbi:DNA-binding response regulator [Streptomyces sp. NPDC060035]|uniref:response regulator transcription factor n=1 Tax=Streptomyces sp. NPDC060035 TaxID=3347044 RepID=UPI0036C259C5
MTHSLSLARTQPASVQHVVRVSFFAEDELLRKGLQKILGDIQGVEIAVSCGSIQDVAQALGSGSTDVLVISAPESTALSACVSGRTIPAPRVLVLLDESHVNSPTPLGTVPADGFLLREEVTAQALERALFQLASDEMPMPLKLGRLLVASLQGSGGGRPARSQLTARERESLAHLAEGLSNKQIARHMGISEHGVKRLVGNVLLKLGATNRTAAAVLAMDAGLLGERLMRSAERGGGDV